jgi:hypothetical protein
LKKVLLLVIMVMFLMGSCEVLTATTGTDYGYVYVTATGSKYHTSSCHYVSGSKIAMTLADALSSGYSACSVCH